MTPTYLIYLVFHLDILNVLIQFGLALVALGQKVEADTADVLVGLELLGTVHVVTDDFEFHHTPLS